MKRLLSFIGGILILLVVASCNKVECTVSGYVVGLKHEAMSTYVAENPVTHTLETRCTPESWIVWVADSCKVHKIFVEKSTFQEIHKGDFVRMKMQFYGKKSN